MKQETHTEETKAHTKPIVPPAQIKKAEKKTKQKNVQERTFYKLKYTPRGTKLFTYTLAVLSVLGGFSSSRKGMRKKDIAAFFATDSVIRHHLKCGNFEEMKNKDMIRLSVAGWNYFHGRLTGSTVAQKVLKPEMEALAEAIKTGQLKEKTEHFPKNTPFQEIHI